MKFGEFYPFSELNVLFAGVEMTPALDTLKVQTVVTAAFPGDYRPLENGYTLKSRFLNVLAQNCGVRIQKDRLVPFLDTTHVRVRVRCSWMRPDGTLIFAETEKEWLKTEHAEQCSRAHAVTWCESGAQKTALMQLFGITLPIPEARLGLPWLCIRMIPNEADARGKQFIHESGAKALAALYS